MELYDRLDDAASLVEEAKAVPLSQSCVVPRAEMLDLLDDVRAAIPEAVQDAELILRQRDDLLLDAKAETDAYLESARTEVLRTRAEARDEADRIIANARAEAERIVTDARAHADDINRRTKEHARSLISAHEITLAAQAEASKITAEATSQAARTKAASEAETAALLAAAEDTIEMTLGELRQRASRLRPQQSTPAAESTPEPSEFFDLESFGGLEDPTGVGGVSASGR